MFSRPSSIRKLQRPAEALFFGVYISKVIELYNFKTIDSTDRGAR